jgi:hypothetical protein
VRTDGGEVTDGHATDCENTESRKKEKKLTERWGDRKRTYEGAGKGPSCLPAGSRLLSFPIFLSPHFSVRLFGPSEESLYSRLKEASLMLRATHFVPEEIETY